MKTTSALLVSSLLLVAAIGCGGSGGSSFSAAKTGSGPGGGTPPATQYSSPVLLTNSVNATVINVSPNGQMVGADSAGAPLYWATPTSAPAAINTGGYSGVFISGINNSGQMAGYASIGGVFNGLYWSSPTATPVILPAPSGGGTYGALTLNVHGAIVGSAGSGSNTQAMYWATPTSAPTALAGVGGGSTLDQEAVRISDGGEIIGVGSSGSTIAWASPMSNAQTLSMPSGDTLTAGNNLLGFAFNQETGEVGGTATVSTTDIAFEWSLPNFSFHLLPTPSGITPETFLSNIGPNHVAIGEAYSGGNVAAAIWPSPTSNYIDLNTEIPAGSGLTLGSAMFMTDSGIIVGQALNSSSQVVLYTIHPL